MFVIAIAKVMHFFRSCKFSGNKFKNYSKKLLSLACACSISPHPTMSLWGNSFALYLWNKIQDNTTQNTTLIQLWQEITSNVKL